MQISGKSGMLTMNVTCEAVGSFMTMPSLEDAVFLHTGSLWNIPEDTANRSKRSRENNNITYVHTVF